MKKRAIAFLLCICMICSIVPTWAFATSSEGEMPTEGVTTTLETINTCEHCGVELTEGTVHADNCLTRCTCTPVDGVHQGDCIFAPEPCKTCGKTDCGSDHTNWCAICLTDNCGVTHIPCVVCGKTGCTSRHLTWCTICRKDDCGVEHVYCELHGEWDCQQEHPVILSDPHPDIGKTAELKTRYLWSDPTNVGSQNMAPGTVALPVYVKIVDVIVYSDTITLYELTTVDGSAWPSEFPNHYVESTKVTFVELCSDCFKPVDNCECESVNPSDPTDPSDPDPELCPDCGKLDGECTCGQQPSEPVFCPDCGKPEEECQCDDDVLVDSNLSHPAGITISGTLPQGTELAVSASSTEYSSDGFKKQTDYDISLLLNGEEYEPDHPVKVTISDLDVYDYSFVKLVHYIEDPAAIIAGNAAGTIQVWNDSSLAAAYPEAAAAAKEALGESNTVCVELLYSTNGDVEVRNGSISFYATSFSIYTMTTTGTDSASGRLYAVYDDDNGTAQNSNGYSETHEITMDDSNGATFMLTRGQKFYLDIGPNFFVTGMTSYQWYLSEDSIGSLDTSGFGSLLGNDTILTVASNAPLYKHYTLKVIGYNLWGTNRGERTINIYVVPEVQLIFNPNIPTGATANNVTVPSQRKTVLGDGTSTVPYTRVYVSNPSGSVTGYTFDGWYTAATGGTKVSSGTYVFLDNDNATYIGGTYSDQYQENLYAHWTPVNYTIGYTLNGGTATNPTSYNIETNTFTLNNPTRAGYTFTGWTGTNGATPQITVTIAKGSTGNKSYTANWSKNSYTINYDLDGGALSKANPTTYAVDTETFTLNNPTKTGYTFTGWTGSNGDAPQTTVSVAKGSTGDKSYTANWTPIAYNITYNLDGGQLAEGVTNPASYTMETDTFTLNNPTREGHSFKGWTGTDLSAATETVTITKGSTGDRSYTATWEQTITTATYTVEIYEMGTDGNYSIIDTKPLNDNVGKEVSYTPDAAQTGFTLDSGRNVLFGTVAADGTLTLKVYYKRNQYTFTTDVDGTKTDQTYYYGAAVTEPADPTKEGYNFAGWDQTVPTTMPANDVTVTAKWSIKMCQLTIKKNCADANQNFVYHVTGETLDGDAVDLKVTIKIRESKKTIIIPAGDYTVTNQDGWTWRYGQPAAQTAVVRSGETEVTFGYTKSKTKWLNGYGNN